MSTRAAISDEPTKKLTDERTPGAALPERAARDQRRRRASLPPPEQPGDDRAAGQAATDRRGRRPAPRGRPSRRRARCRPGSAPSRAPPGRSAERPSSPSATQIDQRPPRRELADDERAPRARSRRAPSASSSGSSPTYGMNASPVVMPLVSRRAPSAPVPRATAPPARADRRASQDAPRPARTSRLGGRVVQPASA